MTSKILFQNEDVCILNPNSDEGIEIFTRLDISRFDNFKLENDNINKNGLYSYNEIKRLYPNFGLTDRHNKDPNHNDLIFFRAPYHYDTASFDTLYSTKQNKLKINDSGCIATIKIDPKQTYVYSSEIRAIGNYRDLLRSRIPLMTYFDRLKENEELISFYKLQYDLKQTTNIITYRKSIIKVNYTKYNSNNYYFNYDISYPNMDYFPIEKNSEIVVKLPNIPAEWLCRIF